MVNLSQDLLVSALLHFFLLALELFNQSFGVFQLFSVLISFQFSLLLSLFDELQSLLLLRFGDTGVGLLLDLNETCGQFGCGRLSARHLIKRASSRRLAHVLHSEKMLFLLCRQVHYSHFNLFEISCLHTAKVSSRVNRSC